MFKVEPETVGNFVLIPELNLFLLMKLISDSNRILI